jgi:acyl-CoA reductase-like NAD-dependent aldehyde dehydrogenase
MSSSGIVGVRQPYIDGKFRVGDGPALRVENPATEETVAEVETCTPSQTEEAIAAARRSFDDGTWARADRRERADAVARMAAYFESRYDDLAATLTAEAGATASMIGNAQVGLPISHIQQAADLYLSLPEQEHTPRPLSDVIASAISAYNFPLWINMWKVIPALLTGNSVILRPSPFTPLSALVFGEAAEAAGLPPGVLNVVAESGLTGAQLLTTHPFVDMVTFTGSTGVGRQIMHQASDTLKRVMLELGGKSVQLYLPDAVDRAPMGCMGVFAAHAGQGCVLPTRMLVPEERKAEVVAKAAELSRTLKIGDPADPSVLVGPLISAAQRDKCATYVAAAIEHGATVASGGDRPAGLDRGYFFEPTVLDVPDNANPAARDEIFGPVLSVLGYRDVEHAVAIANDSIYGLSGQVYGANLAQATDVAERIRSGAVNVNGGASGAYASSGGYKQSGLGRERGTEGVRSFQQIKHLSIGNF